MKKNSYGKRVCKKCGKELPWYDKKSKLCKKCKRRRRRKIIVLTAGTTVVCLGAGYYAIKYPEKTAVIILKVKQYALKGAEFVRDKSAQLSEAITVIIDDSKEKGKVYLSQLDTSKLEQAIESGKVKISELKLDEYIKRIGK